MSTQTAISSSVISKLEIHLIEKFAYKLTTGGNEYSFTDEEYECVENDLVISVSGRITALNSIHDYDNLPCYVIFDHWIATNKDNYDE